MKKRRPKSPMDIIRRKLRKVVTSKKNYYLDDSPSYCDACGRAWADHPGIAPTCETLERLRRYAVNCREAQVNEETHPSPTAKLARYNAEAFLDELLKGLAP